MGLNLLLVENDGVLAAVLAEELRALGHAVSLVDHGHAALAAIGEHQFDAMVLERKIPRLDGLSVVRRLRGGGMTLPVIMVAAQARPSDKVEGLDAGADDYVLKPISAAELNARLGAVLRGRGWTAPGTDTLRAGDITVSPAAFRAWRAGRAIDLGKLELRLLAEFARHADNVLSRATLVERVWGHDFDPRSNIVDVYIRRLRHKLTEAGGNDPILTVRGVGYTLRG